jgi:hypothetical protein
MEKLIINDIDIGNNTYNVIFKLYSEHIISTKEYISLYTLLNNNEDDIAKASIRGIIESNDKTELELPIVPLPPSQLYFGTSGTSGTLNTFATSGSSFISKTYTRPVWLQTPDYYSIWPIVEMKNVLFRCLDERLIAKEEYITLYKDCNTSPDTVLYNIVKTRKGPF